MNLILELLRNQHTKLNSKLIRLTKLQRFEVRIEILNSSFRTSSSHLFLVLLRDGPIYERKAEATRQSPTR